MKKKRFLILDILFLLVFAILLSAFTSADCCVDPQSGCFIPSTNFPCTPENTDSRSCSEVPSCELGCCCTTSQVDSYIQHSFICEESIGGTFIEQTVWTYPWTNNGLIDARFEHENECRTTCQNLPTLCSKTDCSQANDVGCLCGNTLTTSSQRYCCNGQIYSTESACLSECGLIYSISGYVTDKITDLPIQGAEVSLVGGSGSTSYTKVTYTGADGSYSFSQLGQGNIDIAVSAMSYISESKTIYLSSTQYNVNFELQRAGLCTAGSTRLCIPENGVPGQGVCAGFIEYCIGSPIGSGYYSWEGCDFSALPNYQTIETTCNDIQDNDCDTFIDCSDPNCFGVGVCVAQCRNTGCQSTNNLPCWCGQTLVDGSTLTGTYCCALDSKSYQSQTACYNDDTFNSCARQCLLEASIDSIGNPTPAGLTQCVCQGNVYTFNENLYDYCCADNMYSPTGAGGCVEAPKFSVSGTVISSLNFDTISSAVVSLSSISGQTYMTTTTDSLGHFIFSDVPAGNYQLSATKSCGFNSISIAITVNSNLVEQLSLAVLPESAISAFVFITIGGEKRAVSGATVEVTHPCGFISCITDASGHCSVNVFAGSTVSAGAFKKGYTHSEIQTLNIQQQTINAEFELTPLMCYEEAVTPAPEIEDVSDIYLHPDLIVQWKDFCANTKYYEIYRCKATEPSTTCLPTEYMARVPFDSSQKMFTDTGIEPRTRYCYKVVAYYGSALSTWSKESQMSEISCETTGEEICLDALETADPAKLSGTYELCNATDNSRYQCVNGEDDETNTISKIIQCAPPNQYPLCQGPNEKGKTWCTQADFCEECSRPLGMFSVNNLALNYPNPMPPPSTIPICSSIPSCYYDYTKTTVDMYQSCYRQDTELEEFSCYDFKSQSACIYETSNGKCFFSSGDCLYKQHPLYGEIGKGVCYPADAEKQDCSLCEQNQDLFMSCDAQTCQLYGDCYLGAISGCAGSSDLMCGEYLTEQDCTGGRPVYVNVQWLNRVKASGDNEKTSSLDLVNLGVCKWNPATSTCYKDADNNNQDDCPGNYEKCRDKEPPVTLAHSNYQKVKADDFKISFEVTDNKDSNPKLYYCFYTTDETACYPQTQLTLKNRVANLTSISYIPNTEKRYTFRYFAEDNSHNLEELHNPVSVTIDDHLNVDISLNTDSRDILGYYFTDLTVTVDPGEPAYCRYCKLYRWNENTMKFSTTPVPGKDLSEEGLKSAFTASYNNLPDGYYKYAYTVYDEVRNNITSKKEFYIDGANKMYDLSPEGVIRDTTNTYLQFKTRENVNCMFRKAGETTFRDFEKAQEIGGNNVPYYRHYSLISADLAGITGESLTYVLRCFFSGETKTIPFSFTVDQQAPVTTITQPLANDSRLYNPAVYRPEHRFRLTCADSPQEIENFECDNTYYCLTSNPTCDPNIVANNVITINSEAQPRICYYSIDNGGNIEGRNCALFNVDSVLPQVSIDLNYQGEALPTYSINSKILPVVSAGKVFNVLVHSDEKLSSSKLFYTIPSCSQCETTQISLTKADSEGREWIGAFSINTDLMWFRTEGEANFCIEAIDEYGLAPPKTCSENEEDSGNIILSGKEFYVDTTGPDEIKFYLKGNPPVSTTYINSTSPVFNIPGAVFTSLGLRTAPAPTPGAKVFLYQRPVSVEGAQIEYTAVTAALSSAPRTYITSSPIIGGTTILSLACNNCNPYNFNLNYLEFKDRPRADHRRYRIIEANAYQSYVQLRVEADKPIEGSFSIGTAVNVYNEANGQNQYETGWFEVNVELQEGFNEITARAEDAIGNPIQDDPNWFTTPFFVLYDSTPPSVIVTPENGTRAGQVVEITAGITDGPRGVGIKEGSIKLTVNGGENNPFNGIYTCISGLECTSENGFYSVVFNQEGLELPVGVYNPTIEAEDLFGNKRVYPWVFEVANVPKSPSIALDPGHFVDLEWFTNRTSNFDIHIYFTPDLPRIVSLSELFVDGVPLTFTEEGTNHFKARVTSLLSTNTQHALSISASIVLDDGSPGQGTYQKFFKIDAFAPEISLNDVRTNDLISAGVAGNYNDDPPGGDYIDNIFKIDVNGGAGMTTLRPTDGILTSTREFIGRVALPSPATYPILVRATAFDKAGNSKFSENYVYVDQIPPTIENVQLTDTNIYCYELSETPLPEGDCLTYITGNDGLILSGILREENNTESGTIYIEITDHLAQGENLRQITGYTASGIFETPIRLVKQNEAYTTHSLKIIAKDLAENTATNIVEKEVIFDQSAPLINFIEPPNSVYNHQTNSRQPTIRISTNKPSVCEINFAAVGSYIQMDGEGSLPSVFSFLNNLGYSMIHSAQPTYILDNGQYSFNVICTDYLGNQGQLLNQVFVVDANAPQIRGECKVSEMIDGVISDLSCGTVAASSPGYVKYYVTKTQSWPEPSRKVRITAFDEPLSEFDTKEEVKCSYSCSFNQGGACSDNTAQGERGDFSTTGPTDFAFSPNQTILFDVENPKGLYTYNLTCQDRAGNSGRFVLALDIDYREGPVLLEKSPQGFTNQHPVILHLLTQEFADCEYREQETIPYTAFSEDSVGITHTANIGLLAEGHYSYDIKCTDKKQNSIYDQLTFIVDITPPQISINSPESDFSTSIPILPVSLDITEQNPGYLQIYINGEPQLPLEIINTAENPIQNPITKEISLVSGENNIGVVFYDLAGNQGADYIIGYFDNKGPTVEIIAPSNEGPFRTMTNIVAELKETNFGGVDIYSSYIVLEGPSVQDIAWNQKYISSRNTYLLNYTFNTEPENGLYKFTVYSFNSHGLAGESPIRYFTINRNVPEVIFTRPALGERLSTPPIPFRGTINSYGQVLTKADLVLKEVSDYELTQLKVDLIEHSLINSQGNFEANIGLAEGYNEYYILVNTSLSNSGQSPSRYVYIDTTGPLPSELIIGDTPIIGHGVAQPCEETDTGINYFNRGDNNLGEVDCCLSTKTSTSCSDTGSFLKEYYCEEFEPKKVVVTCANGCDNGVCNSVTNKPDLKITGLRWIPEDPVVNRQFTVYVKVKNQGTASVLDPFNIELSFGYFSFTHSVSEIRAGQEREIAFTEPILGSGAYVVNAVADPYPSMVYESDESNNAGGGIITVL